MFNPYCDPPSGTELSAMLPYKRLARYTLCVSHRRRKQLIRRTNALCKQRPHVFVKADKRYPNSQDLYVVVGMELICCKTVEPLGLFNNALFTVVDLGETDRLSATVEELDTREGGSTSGLRSEIPVARIAELFRSAAALTVVQTQGRTLQGSVCVHEWSHPRFTRRHAVVGLSRGTSIDLVTMGPY